MRKHLFVAGLLLALAVPAQAQRSTATIQGAVTDPSGAAIAGAKVTVNNEDTGLAQTTTTNSAGLYSFTYLPVGSYRIDVEFAGFQTAVRSKIGVNVADVRAVDVQLATGEVTESVTVEAAAIAVQTVGGDVSGLVTGEQVRELPLNGRNFLQLALLMPGVSAPDFLNVKDKGLLGGSDLSVSGGDVTNNMWTVDGVNNNDVGSNRTILVYPSLEAIEEFKIHRNAYGAEFGQSAAGTINIVTRGGTNEFHGSAYYFGRRDALNSKNYFLEQANKDKEKLVRNDFGWTFGGPIIKDKLHFFASQEFNRETRGSVRALQVPTALERTGNFSQPLVGCSGPAPVDPLTGQAFPGGVIPADRLSPGGLLYMQLFPMPNTTPGAGSCNNWVTSLDSPVNWRQENLRVDWSISNTTRLMVRYTQDSWKNDSPSLQANLWGDDAFPAVDSNWDQPGKSLVVQLNHNIGSRATNSLSFSYSGNKITVTRGGDAPGLTQQLNQAIPSSFDDGTRLYGSDRGHPLFWGGFGYGYNLWNQANFHNNQDLFVVKDDYSQVFGNHFFKAGVLASTNKKNEDAPGNGSVEAPQFWGSGTGLNGWGGTTGNNLANLLLRDMAFGFSEVSAMFVNQGRWTDFEAYASDSWKVKPGLTIDYGLRFSKLNNPYAADDKIMSFDPALFDPALGNDPCNGMRQPEGTSWCQDAGFLGGTNGPGRSLFPGKTVVAPRLGLAWDISGKGTTVIRAGAGQFYARERFSPTLNIAQNPPFSFISTGTRYLDSVTDPCGGGCIAVSKGSPNAGRAQESKIPNTWQWNVTVEKELVRNTTLELSYVGSKGKDLLRVFDIDQVPPGDNDGNGIEDRLEFARTGNGALRPFGSAFGDKRIAMWDHSGEASYHSMQAQLLSRFGRGSQFQASYTLSKSRGTVPLQNSSGGLGDGTADIATSDLSRPDLDYGPTLVNRTHIFNASLVLLLPTFEEKGGFMKHVLGDWEISTIVGAASGLPVTVYTGSVPGLPGNNSGLWGTGYGVNQRPNRVAGEDCAADSGPKEQILNRDAFTINGFQMGTIGSSGRGVCNGPDFFQVDLAFYKNIKVSERVKLQFRFEVFNVFNRVNFLGNNLNFTMNPNNVTFNGPTVAESTAVTNSTVPLSFGQATATRDPRQAQFGLKLIF